MPLIHFENINENESWALWEISESETELQIALHTFSQEKLNEISHPTKKREWLAGRLLAKKLLENQKIKFQGVYCDGGGKPFLVGLDYHISITHSFPYAAVVLHKNNSAGIDLEKPSEKMQRVASRYLSDEEFNLAKNDILKLGILWCAKEALYKYYGERGLVFREDMLIDPFEISDKGFLKGRILKNGQIINVDLQYCIIEGFVVVITL